MRTILAAVLIALSCDTAFASGGLSCSGEGERASFEVEAGITHGMGGPIFAFSGSAKVADKTIAADLANIGFDKEHVAQYWLDDKELRLLVYRERAEGEHGYVELTIRTQVSEEAVYGGQFELTVFDLKGDKTGEGKTAKFGGTVSCFVE